MLDRGKDSKHETFLNSECIWPFTFQLAPSKVQLLLLCIRWKWWQNACFQFKPMLLWSGAQALLYVVPGTWEHPSNLFGSPAWGQPLPGTNYRVSWYAGWPLENCSNPPLPVLRGTSQRGSFGAPGPKTEVYSAWNKANTKWKLVYMLVKVPKA